jgi:hypothetical protein
MDNGAEYCRVLGISFFWLTHSLPVDVIIYAKILGLD